MTQVLLVGYDPETADFSNPGFPPRMTVEKVRAGIAATLKQMTDRGWEDKLRSVGLTWPRVRPPKRHRNDEALTIRKIAEPCVG